jgi:hypothetical protein
MELVLKMPQGKPPFIGLEFPSSWKGELNKDLVYENADKQYKLILETERQLKMTLVCEDIAVRRVYPGIGYHPARLKNWLTQMRQYSQVNFGHVYLQDGNHKIVKLAGQKNFVLKVVNIELYAS